MALSNDLISQFVKVNKDEDRTKKETTVYATAIKNGDTTYVKIDGSELLTPVVSTADTKNGERVTVMIKNHSAIITRNMSSPAARVDAVGADVTEFNKKLSEFETAISGKVSTDDFDVQKDRIDDLQADNLIIKESLTAVEANMNSNFDTTWQTMDTQRTEIIAECDEIILTALNSYVETGDYETFKKTVLSQLSIMADQLTVSFNTTTQLINEVDEGTQTQFEKLYKYISFDGENGITIGSGENSIKLSIDTDGIIFSKDGKVFGSWDGTDFHTGNIVIDLDERAQFGNFAFIPRSDGSLSFLKVGD